jgi:hypothetical protein
MKSKLDTFAKNIIEFIPEKDWIKVSKLEIENADGRKDKFNQVSQKGSVVYIAYDNNIVLYVGESSISIKRRFISDGAHKQSNNNWYQKMTHVRFLKYNDINLPEVYRKSLEQLLSIEFKPINYGEKT